jgi:hypothetical protein
MSYPTRQHQGFFLMNIDILVIGDSSAFIISIFYIGKAFGMTVLNTCPIIHYSLLILRPHLRKQQHLLYAALVGHKHSQAVDANTDT